MGIYFSYNVIEVTNVRQLSPTLWLANIQCEDEHGHLLAKEDDVLCQEDDGGVQFVSCVENIEDVDGSSDLEAMCENYPGYDAYNPDWLWNELVRATAPTQ